MELAIYVCLYLVVSFVITSLVAYFEDVGLSEFDIVMVFLFWPIVALLALPRHLLFKWFDFISNKKAQKWKKKTKKT